MSNLARKSLSARVMEWQAQPLWRVITTESYGEYTVALAIGRHGIQTYVPTEIRYHPSRRDRLSPPVEAPLIPRVVFAKMELSVLWDVKDMDRNITGFAKDAEDFPEAIPDAQMETFMASHAKWLQDARERAAKGKLGQGRGVKCKTRSMPFRDALMEIQREFDKSAQEA